MNKNDREDCEWNIVTGKTTCSGHHKYNTYWMIEMQDYDFKYCPYCGKPIKIKGDK